MTVPPGPERTLLVAAAPAEARAILRALDADETKADLAWTLHTVPGFDLLVTGVGKANAAGAVGRLFDPALHARVLSIGVAGALPGAELGIGDSIAATASMYADEGVAAGSEFLSMAAVGFPPLPAEPSMAAPPDPAIAPALGRLCGAAGVIATLSTCSGTDAAAQEVVRRTGARAEAMEGAAVGFAVARVLGRHGRFAEARIISNTTGDRAGQIWDLRAALGRLAELAAAIRAEFR